MMFDKFSSRVITVFSFALISSADVIIETKISDPECMTFDSFGRSVSISGHRAIVGAPRKNNNSGISSGSIFIYEFNGKNWIESTILTASDAAQSDSFGFSVSLEGDRAIVGAPSADNDDGIRSGVAYIYDFDGINWIETKIMASDGELGDSFGSSVSISGNRVIVGAARGNSSGSAYIYDFNGTSWIETKITASDGELGDSFGSSVSISGDRAIIGANEKNNLSGAAYIYNFDGTNWNETKITASDGNAALDFFGISVSISGDHAIVGASGANDNGRSSGAAYIYAFDGTNWNETKIISSDITVDDRFGWSSSIKGDRAIVGALTDSTDAGDFTGSAYIFDFDGKTWVETTKLLASDGTSRDNFSRSVSISGDHAIIGAESKNQSTGAAYIYKINTNESMTITKDTIIPKRTTWTIQSGATLTIDPETIITVESGANMENSGFIENSGIINNSGTINNSGLIDNMEPGTIFNSCDGTLVGTIPTSGNSIVQENPCAILINDLIHLGSLDTAYDPSDNRAQGGVFTIHATFTNISSMSISEIFFESKALEGPGCSGCLCTVLSNVSESCEDGFTLSVPDTALGDNGILSPSESFEVVFEIGVNNSQRFSFFIDALGFPAP